VGVQSIVHPEGELATARAARETDMPFILSTASSNPMEDVAEAAGDGARWFQLYWPNEPELTKSFISRAENAGYEAIVVTLDSMLLGWRPRDLQRGYLPFLQGIGTANYLSDPTFTAPLEKSPDEDPTPAVMRWASVFSDPGVVWEDLARIREATDLPILLKGILHPDDAKAAVQHGMNGIVVSNHGGRQVDGSIATLDALPPIVDAVPADFPVLFDSGIRTGSDAVKALALGARAVLLGRPYVWGLAIGGADGVKHVIRAFRADLDLALALSGWSSLENLREAVVRIP
jgi:isopentenyl diphosphate isomerase/L-lactate dehydrogenase-like FMN-dependent dehydrogenase